MTQTSRVVLGLDGGGTKTVCVAVPVAPLQGDNNEDIADLEILSRVVVGSTNWNSVGVEQARNNLQQAIVQMA